MGGREVSASVAVDRKAVLDLSGERDRWERRILDAERAAYLLGREDGYRDGYEHGARLREAEWPDVIKSLDGDPVAELEKERWGPGGREHFADPRPGDGHAAEVRRDAYASGLIPVGKVHLGGRYVHHHPGPCTAACRSYVPGWYTYREAARIMTALPDCPEYRTEIAALRRLADEQEAACA